MSENYFGIEKNSFETIKNSKNNIIFFGCSVGAGKTTILNKICGLNCKNTFSIRKEIRHYFSIKYNNVVIDFPELYSATNIVAYLKVQKNALSVIPIKMICFIVRYTNRYDELLKNVSQMYMIFREYRKNICVIISNSEESTYSNQAEIEHILKTRFEINKIIFSTLKTNEIDLLDKLEKFKADMPNIEHLNIKSHDLTEIVDKSDLDFCDDRETYINDFQKTLKIFSAEFEKATEIQLKRALFFAFKDYKENLIKKYTEIIRNKIADTDAIIKELITFNNQIFNDFKGFEQKCKLELDTLQEKVKGDDNKYKRCPNCGIIWLIESGCQNLICGERSNIKDKRFCYYYNNGKIEKYKTDNNNKVIEKKWTGLSQEEKLENKKRGIGKALIQPLGCGMKLQLNEMEDVTNQIPKEFKILY